jgi:uncharacterized protein (TIGR02646 family)
MIRLIKPLTLSLADQQALQAIQLDVNKGVDYETQVKLADQRWSSKPNTLFQRVRAALEDTCPGARRCGYCEDSLADEIEHVRPKNWFPEQAFDPDNYLFACGPCNGPKSNAYAVVDISGVLTEVKRQKNSPILPPPVGQEALIHPRFDDPADFFFLDLTNTFEFRPKRALGAIETSRADYTIRILRINKDALVKARKEAFNDFAARLVNYHRALERSEPATVATVLDRLRNELLRKQHITVWREMQRQSSVLPFLNPLFALVPGAEEW